MRAHHLLVVCISLVLSACMSLPDFDRVSGVHPRTIVDVIECELFDARKKRNDICRSPGQGDKKACETLEGYKAVADLTLQVDGQLTLAPSFAHTNVVSKSLTRAFDWGLKFDGQAQRTFTQAISFEISELGRALKKRTNPLPHQKEHCYITRPRAKVCVEPLSRVSLNGNLGLDEVVTMAFGTIDKDDLGVKPGKGQEDGQEDNGDNARPRKPKPPNYALLDECGGGESLTKPDLTFTQYLNRPETQRRMYAGRSSGGRGGRGGGSDSAFGTSVEFTLLLSVNSTGPTWTLKHFKGPGKLLTAQRTDTHTVAIGFSLDKDVARAQATRTQFGTLPKRIILGIERSQLLP